jgi:GntR family transcriptional regulator
MHIVLDFRSGIPIYIQIMEQITEALDAGELAVNDQLPTVRQLATELRVNFNTVARAYRMLDEAGIISTQHGRGTYIIEHKPNGSDEILRKQALEGLARHYLSQAKRLGYTPAEAEDTFVHFLQLWKDGDDPEVQAGE